MAYKTDREDTKDKPFVGQAKLVILVESIAKLLDLLNAQSESLSLWKIKMFEDSHFYQNVLAIRRSVITFCRTSSLKTKNW